MRYFVELFFVIFFVYNGMAADSVQPDSLPKQNDINAQIINLNSQINALRDEILQIDSELLRCERMRRNWTTATIIGGVGTVGTLTGAIIQGIQISKQKKQMSEEGANSGGQ